MNRDDQAKAEPARPEGMGDDPAEPEGGRNRRPATGPSESATGTRTGRPLMNRPGSANGPEATPATRTGVEPVGREAEPGWVIETIFSPFHCLYQDALHFHTQSRLARSEGEASRLARAALLLYVCSAEALVHQAAEELGRPELRGVVADPGRPLPLLEACRLLPAIAAEPGVPSRTFDPDSPPWPQFAELLMLRTSWGYPGTASDRRAYYRSARRDGDYEPLQPHQVPSELRRAASPERLAFSRTGFPRDPYALRPRHLDTARGVLDAAIEALDRRMGGALTRGQRHRREPVRVVYPPAPGVES